MIVKYDIDIAATAAIVLENIAKRLQRRRLKRRQRIAPGKLLDHEGQSPIF